MNDHPFAATGDVPAIARDGVRFRRACPPTERLLAMSFAIPDGRRSISVSIQRAAKDLERFVRSPSASGSGATTGGRRGHHHRLNGRSLEFDADLAGGAQSNHRARRRRRAPLTSGSGDAPLQPARHEPLSGSSSAFAPRAFDRASPPPNCRCSRGSRHRPLRALGPVRERERGVRSSKVKHVGDRVPQHPHPEHRTVSPPHPAPSKPGCARASCAG